jgi:GT2 family glycosyltransferase
MSKTHEAPNPKYVDFDSLPGPRSQTLINVHFDSSITSTQRSSIVSSLKLDRPDFCQIGIGTALDKSHYESDKVYELVISAPVTFGRNAIESYCKVIEFCSPDIVYSDYVLGQNPESLIALPAWSPIRLESIDYLGPCILFSAESLEISSDELLAPTLRELVLSQSISQNRNVLRIPESTYACQSEWKNAIIETKNFDEAIRSVSIVIPTRGCEERENVSLIENCLKDLFSDTMASVHHQVVVVLDENFSESVVERLKHNCPKNIKLEFILFDEEFNFSKKCNLGAQHAKYETLLFLNDDTEGITSEKIQRLAKFACREEVGAVGAQLHFDDGSIQHAGVSLLKMKPRHAYLDQFPSAGTLGDLHVTHETSAVTGACLMIQRSKLISIGSWDEGFSNSYNDVDLCLRLNSSGLVSVIVNEVSLTHHESVTRDSTFDLAAFTELKARWSAELGNERFLRNDTSKTSGALSLGLQAATRHNYEGKPLRYLLHLLRSEGLRGTVKKFIDGRKVRSSRLLMAEAHRYL